jgi:hypothetical protein
MLKATRRLSSKKTSNSTSESQDLLATPQRHDNEISPRRIATRHSETSFSELEDQPFGLHVSPRSKTRKSANSFSSADLEDNNSSNNHFLASNIVATSDGIAGGSRHSSRSSTTSSTSSSTRVSNSSTRVSNSSAPKRGSRSSPHHNKNNDEEKGRENKSSSTSGVRPSSRSKVKQTTSSSSSSRRSSSSSSRFKEEESAEEATKRRLAYKEKCEQEILDFQKSLQLEENGTEDTSYLQLKPRSNVVRHSDSLDKG